MYEDVCRSWGMEVTAWQCILVYWDQAFFWCLAHPPGGVPCLPFSKFWVPPSDGTPPSLGLGVGQQWVGRVEGKS